MLTRTVKCTRTPLASYSCVQLMHSQLQLQSRTCLPLSLCRGQAYDGVATMQGKRSGVATRLRNEEPAAIPVHCLAHSLNLCLQAAGKNITVIRDAMEVVRKIVKLINYSPKRRTLFSSFLRENDQAGGSIKPLYPTRLTVRTDALHSVLSQYIVGGKHHNTG